MVNPAGTAEMWTFRKLGLNKISTEKAIVSMQKEISCPRHLTRAKNINACSLAPTFDGPSSKFYLNDAVDLNVNMKCEEKVSNLI